MTKGDLAILEFAGLPGSGKSYWAQFAASELRAAGRPVCMPREALAAPLPVRAAGKARSAVSALLGPPRANLGTAASIFRSQGSPIEGFRRSLQWLDTQARLATVPPPGGMLIMDEGPLQALWSIGIDGNWRSVLESLDDCPYTTADLTVVLEVSPRTALTRLEGRTERHRRLDRLSGPHARMDTLARGAALLDDLIGRWVNRHGSESVVRLTAEDSAATAEQIRHLLVTSPKA